MEGARGKDERQWWEPRFRLRSVLVAFFVLSAVFAGGRYYYAWRIVPQTPIAWRDFEPGAVDALREAGRPVLVQFTADWNPTCQMPIHYVVDTPDVRRAVYDGGYVPVLVDVTNGVPARMELLHSYGEEQIPVTVVHPRDDGEPVVLTGMFTKGELLAAMEWGGESR